jgi:exodeoxyribonuclease VII small subunit
VPTEDQPNADDKQPTFEAALQRLEGIVRDLEEGELGLAESLGHYETGIRLLKQCYTLLDKAERRIQLLSGVDSEGNPATVPFEDAATTLEQKAQKRGRRRSSGGQPPADQAPPNDPDSAGVDDGAGLF